jgi:hypothetical protein
MRRCHPGLLVSAAVLLLGCAVAGGCDGKSGAPSDPTSTSRPPTTMHTTSHALIIGISDPQLLLESARMQAAQLADMRSVGITSVRLEANWDWVQFGGPRSFDWTELDRSVHAGLAAGMTVDLTIDGCPPWAALSGASHDAHPQPASASQFAAWAADVAGRYAPEGVTYFEIWNEPNDSRYWQPKTNPAFYTQMLKDSYRAIKKVDPSVVVMAGGLAPVAERYGSPSGSIAMLAFLQAMYADGAKPYMDVVAVHPYSYPALPTQYESWSAWSQMSMTTPSVRSVMTQYGDANKPVWITEFGAHEADATVLADELKQAIETARVTSWIAAIYIYTIWPDGAAAVGAAIGETP